MHFEASKFLSREGDHPLPRKCSWKVFQNQSWAANRFLRRKTIHEEYPHFHTNLFSEDLADIRPKAAEKFLQRKLSMKNVHFHTNMRLEDLSDISQML
jgi:hypothetical protein